MPFVADASVTMAWHFEDEISEAGSRLLQRALADGITVPAHWQAEVANAALVGEWRGRADAAQTARLVELLASLEVELDDEAGTRALSLLPLARAHRLTAYDTLYLELAERRGLPLATFDRDLAKAARKAGVEVLP